MGVSQRRISILRLHRNPTRLGRWLCRSRQLVISIRQLSSQSEAQCNSYFALAFPLTTYAMIFRHFDFARLLEFHQDMFEFLAQVASHKRCPDRGGEPELGNQNRREVLLQLIAKFFHCHWCEPTVRAPTKINKSVRRLTPPTRHVSAFRPAIQKLGDQLQKDFPPILVSPDCWSSTRTCSSFWLKWHHINDVRIVGVNQNWETKIGGKSFCN